MFEVLCGDSPAAPWLAHLPFPVTALGPARTSYRYVPAAVTWLGGHVNAFDAVILHGIWSYLGYAVWRVRQIRPYFVYAHGMLDPALARVFPAKHIAKTILWKMFEHRLLHDAAAVFFTGEEELQLAASGFRPYDVRPEIVPYCVGEPPGDPERQVELFEAQFPAVRGRRVMLFLSRLHPKKGADLVLGALAALASRMEDWHLVLAGPDTGSYRSSLEKAASRFGLSGMITWTGFLSGDLKWGAFRRAEAFILPSHQENYGIAVVEAMACGTPVLISRRVNIWREAVGEGGGFAEDDTEEGTERLIMRWLSLSDVQRAEHRRMARRAFERHFAASSAADRLIEVLRGHGVKE